MEISPDTLLTANALLLRHGAGAEEYVTQKLWDSAQKGSTKDETQWQAVLEAIKRVREIRAKTKRGS
jgi:urease accessory protein UreF